MTLHQQHDDHDCDDRRLLEAPLLSEEVSLLVSLKLRDHNLCPKTYVLQTPRVTCLLCKLQPHLLVDSGVLSPRLSRPVAQRAC